MDKLLHPAPFEPPQEPGVSWTGIVPDVVAQKLAIKRAVPSPFVLYVCVKDGASPRKSKERRYIEKLGDVVERLLGKREEL